MKVRFLFPNGFIKAGWVLIVLGLIVFALSGYMEKHGILTHVPVFCVYNSLNAITDNPPPPIVMGFTYDEIIFELYIILLVTGFLFIGFSRLKTEDEFTMKLRLESLLWSTFIVFALFLFSVIFIYGLFFIIIPIFCLLLFLIIYNLRFYFVYYKSLKSDKDEK